MPCSKQYPDMGSIWATWAVDQLGSWPVKKEPDQQPPWVSLPTGRAFRVHPRNRLVLSLRSENSYCSHYHYDYCYYYYVYLFFFLSNRGWKEHDPFLSPLVVQDTKISVARNLMQQPPKGGNSDVLHVQYWMVGTFKIKDPGGEDLSRAERSGCGGHPFFFGWRAEDANWSSFKSNHLQTNRPNIIKWCLVDLWVGGWIWMINDSGDPILNSLHFLFEPCGRGLTTLRQRT